MRNIFLSLSLAILFIILLIFFLLILIVYGYDIKYYIKYSITPSEEIEIINQSNTDAIKFKISLINHLGSVAIVYDYYDYKDPNNKFYLDFNIITDKNPLNLLGVFLNGFAIEPEILLKSNIGLKFEEDQYILSFDDSIKKTGFFVEIGSRDEYLKLSEFAKNEGIKFYVKCIVRDTGVIRDISFNLSMEKGRKFFDLIEEYGKTVKGFLEFLN
ncbi:hypothetical protein F0310_04985 (plasmid) [Borrelia sp. A-FGy1]|uniref:hypothetical protein n=1 Tax=Borrelia sp. A-FGy1 TaxID=2608247 RepID=UPI0015F3E612|nr:hypothetical protein [Borrelia sp. A-FGy1]QMU99772.1 hypothetical protein F0310_04985 [Borrelia sp. A-FGy1]